MITPTPHAKLHALWCLGALESLLLRPNTSQLPSQQSVPQTSAVEYIDGNGKNTGRESMRVLLRVCLNAQTSLEDRDQRQKVPQHAIGCTCDVQGEMARIAHFDQRYRAHDDFVERTANEPNFCRRLSKNCGTNGITRSIIYVSRAKAQIESH